MIKINDQPARPEAGQKNPEAGQEKPEASQQEIRQRLDSLSA
jgi:hypothetical protein